MKVETRHHSNALGRMRCCFKIETNGYVNNRLHVIKYDDL